ncbi:DUF397 domain-containing protein [Saccharopolyspora sp. NPDC050389]|uniref:DUF397 domain-containing protein n=1 Tax=Saccharopolyspora sp. NPDC050389 TaxID=3155516 RepID=UPI0033C127D0
MTSDDLRHLPWHKSSYSGNSGNCVEVAGHPDGTRYVRDTKDRERGVLAFGAAQWAAFVVASKAGELDR